MKAMASELPNEASRGSGKGSAIEFRVQCPPRFVRFDHALSCHDVDAEFSLENRFIVVRNGSASNSATIAVSLISDKFLISMSYASPEISSRISDASQSTWGRIRLWEHQTTFRGPP